MKLTSLTALIATFTLLLRKPSNDELAQLTYNHEWYRDGLQLGPYGSYHVQEIAKRIPPGQRLVKTWPVLHYGPIPKFDGANWDLEVSGEDLRRSFEAKLAGRELEDDVVGGTA